MKDNNNSLAVPNLTIPPEAVEAAAREIYDRGEFTPMSDARLVATAAIRAALAAWPGVGIFEDETGWDVHIELPLVILLNTENPDAEA